MVTRLKNKKTICIILIVIALVLAILIPLGFASGEDSGNIIFDNRNSPAGGDSLKNSIDRVNYYCSRRCPIGKVCQSNTPKCIRATTLHTEKCLQDNSSDCRVSGYSYNETITYGNTTTTSGVLTPGDAFDCDVDGDGTYDSATERFYFVSEYYDTNTRHFNDKVAVLIYYSNVLNGIVQTLGTSYNCSGQSYKGPEMARVQLPKTTQWSNVTLYKDSRQILTNYDGTTTTGGTLPSNFSYAGYSARLLTSQEYVRGCDNGNCEFLKEGTNYATNSNRYTCAVWLEGPDASDSDKANAIKTSSRCTFVSSNYLTSHLGVRPAIEVLKSDISY